MINELTRAVSSNSTTQRDITQEVLPLAMTDYSNIGQEHSGARWSRRKACPPPATAAAFTAYARS
jgi:hypothetical protein